MGRYIDTFNGMTGSKTNISESINEPYSSMISMLPIAVRVSARTISSNLVSVAPTNGIDIDLLNKIKSEIKSENRDSKIDSIVSGTNHTEKTIKDHPDYIENSRPNPSLFYLDFKYGSTQSDYPKLLISSPDIPKSE